MPKAGSPNTVTRKWPFLKAHNDKDVDAVIAYLKAGPPAPALTTTTTTGGDPKNLGLALTLFTLPSVIIIPCHYAWCALRSVRTSMQTP